MAIEINGFEIPEHISYSALSTYVDCGQKYYLTRMVKVSETPAWYFIGGSAVHTASEIIDGNWDYYKNLGDTADTNLVCSELFRQEWDKHCTETREQNPDVPFSEYKAGGRASKQYPLKENDEWWFHNGPQMVKNWLLWRQNSHLVVWEPSEGKTAVELGIELPMDSWNLRMFIDRVFVTPNGEMVVLDLKTGARTPTSDLQLAIYAAGIEKVFGVRPRYGTYWMGRSGSTTELVDLDYLPTDKILNVVSTFDTARKGGIFLPNLSNCSYCNVAQHCEWSKK